MSWLRMLERLHINGKLSATRLDKAKSKKLINATQVKKIKAEKLICTTISIGYD